MSDKEQFQYRDRAKKGDFFEIEGAFGDRVFVPKSFGGPDPAATEQKNRIYDRLLEIRFKNTFLVI